MGLDYLHYGVGAGPLTAEGVESVCEFIDRHTGSGKVLIHCRKGPRAAALVLLHQAKALGWQPDEVIVKARGIGLEVEGGLRLLVETYLREHPTAP